MRISNRYIASLAFVAGLVLVTQPALGGQVYRYINENGVPVIDDRVPPKFIVNGYDILDSTTLSVIKRIPRQLTEEELRLRNTDEARAQLKAEEEERMKAWDESLMVRYSSVTDIRAAQTRAVKDLQIRISILKSNLISIKSQIEREQQKAANFERRGQDVPKDLARNIQIMRQEIEDTEQSIAIRQQEVEEVRASYERDIDRFATLEDRVRLRSQAGSSK